MRAEGTRQGKLPSALVVAGGALSALSVIPKWFDLSVRDDPSADSAYNGTDLETVVWAVVAFGVMIAIIGVIQLVGGPGARSRGVVITAAILAVVPTMAGAISLLRPAAALAEFGEREITEDYGLPDGFDVDDVLQGGEDEGTLDVTAGIGPYAALLGGLMSLAAVALLFGWAPIKPRPAENEMRPANEP